LDSHTTEYLASKIEEVIEKIGSNRIAAIVSDNVANIKKARAIINEKYPLIESVRCISHCINLIACDIVSHNFADRLLHRVNILTTFFRNSYMAVKRYIYLKTLSALAPYQKFCENAKKFFYLQLHILCFKVRY
jgi:hypothetical protein